MVMAMVILPELLIMEIRRKVFELKKIFSYLTAGIFTISLLLINISYAVQGSENLWAKFLKYDLCITDYNSLNDETKSSVNGQGVFSPMTKISASG